MRWFRFYDDALDDPKVQRLPPNLFKTWANLLCLASKANGRLPSNDDIAFRLRLSIHDAAQQVEDLILAELIDILPNGDRVPHNWNERQYASDSSAERMRKHRQKKKKVTCDVTGDGTVTVQNHNQNQNREESLGHLSSSSAARAREDDQKDFKPILKGKDDDRIVRRAEGLGIPVDDLIAAVDRHKAKNRAAYFTTLCVQWVHQRVPALDEQAIRDALWSKGDESYVAVMRVMLEAV